MTWVVLKKLQLLCFKVRYGPKFAQKINKVRKFNMKCLQPLTLFGLKGGGGGQNVPEDFC